MTCKSSTLLSIFKRKGGEGFFTKIISRDNLPKYEHIFSNYIEDETPIIVQYTNENYWLVFSDVRIILAENNNVTNIWFETIKKVSAPVFQEALLGVKNLSDFSLIELDTDDKQKYLLKTEVGLPYTGLFHMLQFLSKANS